MLKRRLAALVLAGMLTLVFSGLALAVAPGPVSPQDGTISSPTTFVVNGGPDDQTAPHLSGDIVSYTSEPNGDSDVRIHSVSDSSDVAIPKTEGLDSLSDVAGHTVVYTHVTDANNINVYDADTASVTTINAVSSTQGRNLPSIGGQTIAWTDYTYNSNLLESEIVVYDLQAGTSTRLTNDALQDRLPSVSPDGNTIVWSTCELDQTGCIVRESVRTAGVWSAPLALTIAADGEANGWPVTDGSVVVYSLTDTDNERDIYWQPVGGGAAHQLILANAQNFPSVSNGVISFASFETNGGVPGYDLYVYDIAANTLYRVTQTTQEETLNDIFVSPDRQVTVVWQRSGATFDVVGETFSLPALPASLVLSPVGGSQDVGTQGVITATVEDAAQTAVAGVVVQFTLTGAVTATGSCTTGQDGTCAFTYDGPTTPGDVGIAAYVDTDQDGLHQSGEPTASATRSFEQQQLSYTFRGFFWPVFDPPTVNYGHARGLVPLLWQLKDADGSFVQELSAVTSLTYQQTNCTTFVPLPGSTSQDAASLAGSALHYDAIINAYHFNWQTPHDAGCYTFSLTLDSGQTFQANFSLHRPTFWELLGDAARVIALRVFDGGR